MAPFPLHLGPAPSSPQHTRFEFDDDDPERLREVVRGVDTEHLMVGGSRLRVRRDRVEAAELSVDVVRYDGSVVIRGAFDPQPACIGVTYESHGEARVNGAPIRPYDIQYFGEGCEVYYRPAAHTQFAVVVAPPGVLNALAEALEGRSLPFGREPFETLSPEGADRTEFAHGLQRAIRTMEHDPDGARMAVAEILVRHALRAAGNHDLGRPRDARLTMGRLRLAMDHLMAHMGTPFNGSALARATGAPLRAIEYTFREALGMSPRKWHRTARLQAARRDLRLGSPSLDHVSRIAERWGFRHLGRFAATYAESFGEAPHETLRYRSS